MAIPVAIRAAQLHKKKRKEKKNKYAPGLELRDGREILEADLDVEGSVGEEAESESVGEEREDDARNEEWDHCPLAVPQRRH